MTQDGRSKGGVILLSYNRPMMLGLARASIAADVPVILVDDGSDVFDPAEWADKSAIIGRVFAVRRSIEHRMSTPSLGRLINGAIHLAANHLKLDWVAYLCDDDLFAPGWLEAVGQAFTADEAVHVVRGEWRSFDDPLKDGWPMERPRRSRPCPLDQRRMTTGNFAHRTACYREGLRWSEVTVAVHDDTFIWNMLRLHPAKDVRDLKVLAGYRREHAYNGAHYTAHQSYAVGAFEWLSRGPLE